MSNIISVEVITSKILLVRGKRVMLDKDLAMLYGVETRQLTRQVRRNIERFPEDFMLQLTKEEFQNLMCHFGTSNRGGTRKLSRVCPRRGLTLNDVAGPVLVCFSWGRSFFPSVEKFRSPAVPRSH